MSRIRFDPATRQWVFPDGRRLLVIMGGSATVHDEVPPRGRDTDVELEEDDDEEEQDDDKRRSRSRDEDEDDDEDERDADQYVSRTDHERIKTALRNERREKKKLRRDYEERVQRLESESTESSAVEVEKARIDERNKRDSYWSEQIIRARAATEFAAQGASSRNAERLAGMVDLKKISYDEHDREFDGLEEEIEDIISENPEFFKTKEKEEETTARRPGPARPRIEAASRGGRGGGGGQRRPVRSADKLAARALGRSARRA